MVNGLRRVGQSAVYWLIATALLVSLTVGIFLVADVVRNNWFPVNLLLAPLFVLIGLALIIVGGRSSAPGVSARRTLLFSFTPVSLIGLGILVGGCLYGLTGNVDAIIYSFAGSVAAMVLVSILAGHRRRS